MCDNVTDFNDKPNPEKAEGIIVKLKCSFKDSQAGQDLNQDLYQIDSEKISKTIQKRKGTSIGYRNEYLNQEVNPYLSKRKSSNSLSRGQIQVTSRPFSAKSDIYNFNQSPYNKRNFSNRLIASQKFLNATPSVKSMTKRPNTAISHAVLQTTASFENLKTVDNRYRGPRTF